MQLRDATSSRLRPSSDSPQSVAAGRLLRLPLLEPPLTRGRQSGTHVLKQDYRARGESCDDRLADRWRLGTHRENHHRPSPRFRRSDIQKAVSSICDAQPPAPPEHPSQINICSGDQSHFSSWNQAAARIRADGLSIPGLDDEFPTERATPVQAPGAVRTGHPRQPRLATEAERRYPSAGCKYLIAVMGRGWPRHHFLHALETKLTP